MTQSSNHIDTGIQPAARRRVIVAVCTFRRNEALKSLLQTVADLGQTQWLDAELGITVVDDSPEQDARDVVERFSERFPLGVSYVHSGARNISRARNLALEDAMLRGDWIAMTDDDCVPDPDWLSELMRVQSLTGADVTTGLMKRTAPDHAPGWIKSQPFLELGEFDAHDGSLLATAFTNNCLISGRMLRERRDLRFDPAFGKIGGEDMVFFRTVSKLGYRIAFAERAFVYESEPDDRLTLGYQLRRYFWHGNSFALTSLHNKHSRMRILLHAVASVGRAAVRPFVRMARGSQPQFLYGLALVQEGLGKLVGVLGIRVSHK